MSDAKIRVRNAFKTFRTDKGDVPVLEDVALDVRENAQLEGNYGFRLVPVSGAGLSEREPVAGDVPEMRVVLDVSSPQIDLYPPVSDPNAPDTLILQWKATDRNFGEEPITLLWSELPSGPWKPVASGDGEPVVQATAGAAPVTKRLPNTGQFAWRVPAGWPSSPTACRTWKPPRVPGRPNASRRSPDSPRPTCAAWRATSLLLRRPRSTGAWACRPRSSEACAPGCSTR